MNVVFLDYDGVVNTPIGVCGTTTAIASTPVAFVKMLRLSVPHPLYPTPAVVRKLTHGAVNTLMSTGF